MTEDRHTPGPWAVVDCGFDGMDITGDDGRGRVVANMDNADEVDEANVRLVAAAPTMYTLLEKLAREGHEEAQTIIAEVSGVRS